MSTILILLAATIIFLFAMCGLVEWFEWCVWSNWWKIPASLSALLVLGVVEWMACDYLIARYPVQRHTAAEAEAPACNCGR